MHPPFSGHIKNRRGAALITVMLLVLLLMVAIAGAFTRTMTERRTALDATAQVDAFAIAQSGIDQYLIAHTSVPTTLPDSATYAVTGGRAVVTLRFFRKANVAPVDTVLLITSRGEATSNRYNATASRATRTVSQLVRFTPGLLDVKGAFVALNGMAINGNSASYSGVDYCTTPPAPLASVPGLSVPSTSGSPSTPLATANPGFGVVYGNPSGAPSILGTPGPTGTAADAINIDWYGISQRTAMTPDYWEKTVSPMVGWTPSSPPTSGSAWPITFVLGDYSGKFPGNGQGIFIVTGDLTLNGNSSWNGIVLVGGSLTGNGNNTIYGAIYAGLNITVPAYNPPNAAQTAFPVPVGMQTVGNGIKLYQYDSCAIQNALKQFGDWARLGNAWTDNWPSY